MHAAMQNDAVSVLAAVLGRDRNEACMWMQMMHHLKLVYAADLSWSLRFTAAPLRIGEGGSK